MNKVQLAFGVILTCTGSGESAASFVLPYLLENGQPVDADEVMANYNPLVNCVNLAAPAGSTNAVKYKGGSGSFGVVGPLTDVQTVVGSMRNPPQAATLTAEAGINIVNAPGNVTISAPGTPSEGLYHQVLSATPTSARINVGLSTELNKSTAVMRCGFHGA